MQNQDIEILRNHGYELEPKKTLGKGSFGKVSSATSLETQESFAVKIIPKAKGTPQQTLFVENYLPREMEIMRTVNHKHIIKTTDVIETDDKVYFVMEVATNGMLRDFVKRQPLMVMSEGVARHYFRQILSGVEYLHKNNIAHRDIKHENILLDENNDIKLIDFGTSRFFNPEEANTESQVGTLYFLPPEVIRKDTYCLPSLDIWSLGVVLFYMIHGKVPFKAYTIEDFQARQSRKDFITNMNVTMSRELTDLLNHMLEPKVEERATLNEIRQHAWTKLPTEQPEMVESSEEEAEMEAMLRTDEEEEPRSWWPWSFFRRRRDAGVQMDTPAKSNAGPLTPPKVRQKKRKEKRCTMQ